MTKRLVLAAVLIFAVAASPAQAQLPTGRTDYRQLADYTNEIAALAAAHPDSVRRIVIGTSVQGRPLEGLEIADGVNRTDDGRPLHIEIGLIHAREWTTGEVVMEWAHELAESADPRFARLRARTRTVLIPVANPDGFEISKTTTPLWRTNANGVDLNRNAGAFWGGPDGSDTVGSDNYRGPAPFSEPESRAIHDYSASHQVSVIDLVHSYGGEVLYQPGFRRTSEPGLPAGTAVPGHKRFEALAQSMADATGYAARPASYPTDITGATEDWNYFVQFATAFTVELGGGEFQPTYQVGVIDQYPGMREALLRAGEAAETIGTHAVLKGTAPAGRTLKLSRTVKSSTSYVVTHTDTDARVGKAVVRTEHLTSTLTVPASGKFTWAVNPSVRPLDVLAGKTHSWTLRCRKSERKVRLRLAQTKTLHVACRG